MSANTTAPSATAAESRDTMVALAMLWLIPALAFLAALLMVH